MLGLPDPEPAFRFMVVAMENGVSLDFMESAGAVASQHYAFVVDDARFDAAMALIAARMIPHWADPARARPGEINHREGGRGVYFTDPDGHFLELIVKPQAKDPNR